METVIYNLLESIKVCGSLLEAFIPDTSKEILRQINTNSSFEYVSDNTYELNEPKVLFQRIDKDKFEI